MKNIVFFVPNSRWFNKRPWINIPYAALIITALLRDQYNLSILDANGDNLSADDCRQQLAEAAPDFILVTAVSVEYHRQAHKALEIAKDACPQAITILGGVYPTTLPEEAIKDLNADWLFMYQAEERLPRFLTMLSDHPDAARNFPGIAFRGENGSMVLTPPDILIGDVKVMVKPDYSKLRMTGYLQQATIDYQFNSTKPTSFIITSYGCPYNCVFCASRTISGKRVVYRPVEDVIDEIEYLITEHGVGNLLFLDDAFLADNKRVNSLLETFITRNYNITWKAATVSAWHLDDRLLELMVRSGCTQITVSVESGSQRVMNEIIHKPLRLEIIPPIVKKCREVGIDIGANFVIGFPGETWEEIRQTFKFAEECDFDVAHFHIATPLPKTDLYKICKEKGCLAEDFSFVDPKFFGFGAGFITTEEFTPFELMVVRAFEYDRINFNTPEKLARVARLYCTTVEKLNEHRRQTRRKIGVHF